VLRILFSALFYCVFVLSADPTQYISYSCGVM